MSENSLKITITISWWYIQIVGFVNPTIQKPKDIKFMIIRQRKEENSMTVCNSCILHHFGTYGRLTDSALAVKTMKHSNLKKGEK